MGNPKQMTQRIGLMTGVRWRRVVPGVALALLLVTSAGCGETDPSSYDQVQEDTSQRGASAVSDEAQRGSAFNPFFPDGGQGYSVVYVQEKTGFSAAKLEQGGRELAMLSINDTVSTPDATTRYQNSSEELSGYPVADIGNNQTGLLVGDRYQVKVASKDSSFTAQNRREWLQQFDLSGLEQLK
jgi:hypothetical protein